MRGSSPARRRCILGRCLIEDEAGDEGGAEGDEVWRGEAGRVKQIYENWNCGCRNDRTERRIFPESHHDNPENRSRVSDRFPGKS